jgi:hypothetical protein
MALVVARPPVSSPARIDQPAPGVVLSQGEQRIAGIAYAGLRGIQQVEFSADGGETWQMADLLEPAPGPDAWVRWQGTFQLAAGSRARLVARATDGTGESSSKPSACPSRTVAPAGRAWRSRRPDGSGGHQRWGSSATSARARSGSRPPRSGWRRRFTSSASRAPARRRA